MCPAYFFKVYSHRLSGAGPAHPGLTLQLAQWLHQSSEPPSNVRLLNTEAGGIGDGRDLPFRSPPKYFSWKKHFENYTAPAWTHWKALKPTSEGTSPSSEFFPRTSHSWKKQEPQKLPLV